MNQEQAKKFIMLYETLLHPEIVFNHHHVANLEHIERFSKVGVYQWRDFYGEWISSDDINFCGEPENYRPVPERKINWTKALKNGAWGQEFLFTGKYPACRAKLQGYFDCPKIGDSFIALHGDFGTGTFTTCEPLPNFEIPDSWLED